MRALWFVLALMPTAAGAGPACGLYTYKANIVDVYDADTVTADIATRTSAFRYQRARNDGGGEAAWYRLQRRASKEHFGEGSRAAQIKDRKEKYGCYLAEIWFGDKKVNDWLVAHGFAHYQEY